jgi:hypothetical protein
MIRRAFRRGLSLGILAAMVAAAVKAVQGRKGGPLSPLPASEAWPATAPAGGGARASLVTAAPGATGVGLDVVAAPGPDPQPSREAAEDAVWLDPVERGCPASHPVKVRLASGIFHLPGMVDYERTRPDRCYVDATAAESDGFRAALR